MKQTIEIEVPDGKKAVWKDGEVVFEDIERNPPKLPKTWEEFCDFYPVVKNSACLYRDYKSEQAARQYLIIMQLHQLRDCYRSGWKPNWEDNNSDRYGIERIYDRVTGRYELRVVWCDHVSKFLLFPTYELAKEFLTNFREIIEQAGDLI